MKKEILQGISQHSTLELPDINEQLKQIALNTSLYTDAKMVRKSDIKLLLAETSLSTNKWDTISVSRVSALNALIAQRKTYPSEFAASFTEDDETYSASGTFEPWKITQGGDGRNVNIKVIISSGSFSAAGKKYDIAKTALTVQVKLNYFPIPDPKHTQDGSYKLKVRASSANPEDPIAAIVSFTPPAGMGKIAQTTLKTLLGEWLNDPKNLQMFDTLFATVVINNMGSNEEFKWLKATHMSYAYTDSNTEDSCIFGVLCMTNDRSSAGAPNQLPAVVLENNDSAAFIISREVFVKYQFLPSLVHVFNNAQASDFSLDSSGLIVTAKNLKMDGVKYGAITYRPVVENFKVAFNESEINTTTQISTEISPGIVAKTTILTAQTFALSENSKKEQIMIYKNIGEPNVINKVEVATGVVVTEVIVGIIIAVVGLAVGKAVETVVKRVIIAILAIIVTATINAIIHVIIERIVAGGVVEQVPSISPMVKALNIQVLWPFSQRKEFDLRNIEYNGALAFYGKV